MALFICHWGAHFLSTICYIFILPKTIVGIFKNHGIDKETGKRVKENVIHDFFDEIDDLMGYEGASEVIFVPEEYGLDKEATIQEIVDYILENQNIG